MILGSAIIARVCIRNTLICDIFFNSFIIYSSFLISVISGSPPVKITSHISSCADMYFIASEISSYVSSVFSVCNLHFLKQNLHCIRQSLRGKSNTLSEYLWISPFALVYISSPIGSTISQSLISYSLESILYCLSIGCPSGNSAICLSKYLVVFSNNVFIWLSSFFS